MGSPNAGSTIPNRPTYFDSSLYAIAATVVAEETAGNCATDCEAEQTDAQDGVSCCRRYRAGPCNKTENNEPAGKFWEMSVYGVRRNSAGCHECVEDR